MQPRMMRKTYSGYLSGLAMLLRLVRSGAAFIEVSIVGGMEGIFIDEVDEMRLNNQKFC